MLNLLNTNGNREEKIYDLEATHEALILMQQAKQRQRLRQLIKGPHHLQGLWDHTINTTYELCRSLYSL